MSSREVSIKVENVSKLYQIYGKPQDRLKQSLFRNRRRFYHEFWAVRGVSLQVHKGETLGIVGRNGSGKSSLLQIICGTLTPTGGSVEVAGRVSALLELGSGFNADFTGRENVYLNAAVLGLSYGEIRDRFSEIEKFADIGQFMDQPMKTYSSGMFMRLAFAVAINVDPDILIVDEALSVGDEAFSRKCFARIEKIKNGGGTILFVSHSAGLVVDLCDRAVLLDRGEKIIEGSPKGVINRYQRLVNMKEEDAVRYREDLKKEAVVGDPPLASTKREKEIQPDGLTGDNPAVDDEADYFLPGFVTQSRVEYEPRGALIKNTRIITPSGREVNHLVHNRRYVFNYEVEVLTDIYDVRLGCMLKNSQGTTLGGGNYPSVNGKILVLRKGSVFKMEYNFRCLMEEGVYFLNAGLMASQGEEWCFAHRIIDVFMFRVLPRSERESSGPIDFQMKIAMKEGGA